MRCRIGYEVKWFHVLTGSEDKSQSFTCLKKDIIIKIYSWDFLFNVSGQCCEVKLLLSEGLVMWWEMKVYVFFYYPLKSTGSGYRDILIQQFRSIHWLTMLVEKYKCSEHILYVWKEISVVFHWINVVRLSECAWRCCTFIIQCCPEAPQNFHGGGVTILIHYQRALAFFIYIKIQCVQ